MKSVIGLVLAFAVGFRLPRIRNPVAGTAAVLGRCS